MLCAQFNEKLWIRLAEFNLDQFVTPLFQVHVVGFACFKLLLPRLQQNLKNYQESKDPAKELNKHKDFFKDLYRKKLQGAKQSYFWEQKLTETMQEIIVEIFLNPIGSQETHDLVYNFIKNCGSDRTRKDFIFSMSDNRPFISHYFEI